MSHGILIGHISPEALRGAPIAAVREGDLIVISHGAHADARGWRCEIARRMVNRRASERSKKARLGSVHDKYTRLVSSAHYGGVL